MKAYGSLGYLDNQGTTKGQEYQRYTMRTNVELNPKEWITFGAGVNGSWQYQDYGQSSNGRKLQRDSRPDCGSSKD